MEAKRAEALVTQFNREFARRGLEVVRTVESIAASSAARDIAISPDASSYVDQAAGLASTHGLDLLELGTGDGGMGAPLHLKVARRFELCGPGRGTGFHARSRPVGTGSGRWRHRLLGRVAGTVR